MEQGVFIAVAIGLILLLLIAGVPRNPLKQTGKLITKLVIGAVALFLINAAGGSYGIHIPINIPTTLISGILGVPGIAALVVVQKWIIG
ncbi:pro-sigmaK processing inhibitor BofA family protein [Pradoshia sp.]